MPEFRIYYDGGETYDGDPFYAPALGVLAIIQKDTTHGRRLHVCKDYFVWMGKGWLGVDFIGMIDYLTLPGAKRVLIGRMVDKEYFYKVAAEANNDPDFPERTGWHNDEVKV